MVEANVPATVGTLSEDDEVIRAIQVYRNESEDARWERLERNRKNRDVFLGRQDWSHKQEGQSAEFIPKVGIAIEQMTAFIRRGMIQFGDWFSVELDETAQQLVGEQDVIDITNCFFNNLWAPNNQSTNIFNVVGDAVKNGFLESLIILKVHGASVTTREIMVEPPTDEGEESDVEFTDVERWRLRIDLVRPEDYYPDPTGNGLYEIHRVERDLHEVVEAAEAGIYDMEAVRELIGTDHTRPEDEERGAEAQDQQEPTTPSFRKRVVLDEFWGTLLAEDGTVKHRNVVATVANEKHLIRKPEPNPFWHQESPFVVGPLIRVPWSVWHKALFDHGCDLNMAINEIFNLILDGGMATVWGIKQVRLEDLEDPGQVAGGIPQGETLAVKSTLPHGMKVLENVTEGEVPQDAMAVYEFLNREFNQAVLTNDLKLGALPSKQVLATEVLEASQSQSVTLDGVIADLETNIMEPLVRKAWLTILQNADDIPAQEWLGMTSRMTAEIMESADPAERFQLFNRSCAFKVNGLSSTVARARDFQKIMALMQAVQVNPALFQAFMLEFSPQRTLRAMIKALNLNPKDLKKSKEELANAAIEMQNTQAAAGMLQQAGARGSGGESGAGSVSGPTAGGEGTAAAEANQMVSPTSGLAPNQ